VSAVNPPFRHELVKPGGQGGLTKLVTVVAVFFAASMAAISGLEVGSGSKTAIVLPLAAAVGLAMAVLALTRFSVYVALMLILRSSLDLAKLSGSAAGNTATNSTSTRGLDPASLLAVLFLLMAGLWLAAQARRQGGLPTATTMRRGFLWWITAAALSALGSGNVTSSALELVRLLAAIMMFVVLEQLINDHARLRRFLVVIYCSLIFPMLFTFAGLLTNHARTEVRGGFTRITGTFQTANDYGRYLMLMIIMAVALYPYLNRRWRKVLMLVLVPSLIQIVLTYTLTALGGMVIGLVVVGLMQSKKLLLTMGVAAVCVLVLVPPLASRVGSIGHVNSGPGVVTSATTGNSLIWRFSYWSQVLPLANHNPFTGIGLDQTQYQTDQAKQPHNDFVRAYVEMGIIGFCAFVYMLVCMVGLGRKAARAGPRGTLDRGVGVGFLGCAVAWISVSFAANVMSNVQTLWYLFAFAAAASAVVRMNTTTPAAANLINGSEGTVRGDQ